MLFQIKHRWTGAVLFALETESMKLCVEAAVAKNVSLDGASLVGASLDRASLDGASLNGASLNRASLDGASLDGASLNRASLNRASLNRASLEGASLNGASLNGASLNRASLDGASLYGASLNRASLDGASLVGASLNRASLDGASLDGASGLSKLTIAQNTVCPTDGEFTAWKKLTHGAIAKLTIPADAQRVNAIGARKCRASKAVVQAMFKDGSPFTDAAYAQHDGTTKYEIGQIVTPDLFDPDYTVECSHGIHFFITRTEAENY